MVEWLGAEKFMKKFFDPHSSLEENLSTLRAPEQISIVLRNINGSNGDTYSRQTIEALDKNGHLVVFSHWRNSNWHDGREPKNFQTFTDTEDVNKLITHVHELFPNSNIYLVGMSQGG